VIPGPDGQVAPGTRRVNWVWYVNQEVGEEEEERAFTDVEGKRRRHSVP
jgi:hypothetical protein